ncbi:hypothetical protein U1Q18_004456 [Sarracenia purpurea var. burkii]
MSVDDKESVILKGLQSGAAFFIVKPISPHDLKNLWQYAVAKRRAKAAIVEEIEAIQEPSIQADHKLDDGLNEDDNPVQETSPRTDKGSKTGTESAASAVNGSDGQSAKETKRKSNGAAMKEIKDDSGTQKKAKVIWTNALHNQFLEAIKSLGIDRAVPKKILELMNVPGITRENVASHLQKYRIFLKRVSEASYKIQSAAERSMVERTFRSTFASGHPSFTFNRSDLQNIQNLEADQDQISTITSLQHRYGGGGSRSVPVAPGAAILGHTSSSNQESSSPSSPTRFGSSQTRLLSDLSNQSNLMKQPMVGCAKLNDRRPTSLLIPGNTSGGLMTDANRSQISPKSFGNGFSRCIPEKNSTVKSNFCNNNYAGYRLASDGRLIGLGYIGSVGADKAPTDHHLNRNNGGLINIGMQNGSIGGGGTLPEWSRNSGDRLAREAASTGFDGGSFISQPILSKAIQEDGTAVAMAAPAPVVPATLPLQNDFNNLGGSEFNIFGLLGNESNSDSNPFLQPYDGSNDLSFAFPNQINVPSPTQEDDEEFLRSVFGPGEEHDGNDIRGQT